MKTLSVDSNHDIHLDRNGNIAIADELEGLRQKVESVLRLIRGEWVLDKTVGVPYMESVFVLGATEGTVKNVYDKAILDVPEVVGITNSTGVLDRPRRKFYYTAQVQTIYGRLDITNGLNNQRWSSHNYCG
jgi:hypothetical protein